jgi:hypothetical protein
MSFVSESSRASQPVAALSSFVGVWLVPQLAFACPMCFGGNNQNQEAFLYGSLFLMIVPVTAIGSLLYWAYRRYRAWDEPSEPPKAPHEVGTAPVLRVVGRR